jgi:hypothetical protein
MHCVFHYGNHHERRNALRLYVKKEVFQYFEIPLSIDKKNLYLQNKNTHRITIITLSLKSTMEAYFHLHLSFGFQPF